MRFELLSPGDLDKVHEVSIDILKKIGISTKSKRFKSLLCDSGCAEKGDRILFTQEIIDQALKTVPPTWEIYGRDGGNVVEMGKQKAYAQTCIGLPSILDIDNGERRDVTYQDLADFTRVFDALDFMHIVSPIYPRDIPQQTSITMQTAALLRNTTKPIKLCLESAEEWKYVYEILAATAGSEQALREKPLGYFEISPISPLDFAEGPAEAMIEILQSGLPFGVIPAPIMGATGPMTIAGSVAQHNAEMLAGVIASQLIRPGSPVIMSSRVGSMDMRTGVALWAMPEMGLAGAANIQLSRYYGIPCGAGCYTGSSKKVDAQSGYERLYNTLLPALTGIDVCGTAGAVDNALIASYEMLVIDNELSSVVQRTLKGIEVSEDKLALEVIAEVIGNQGNFLEHKHTRKHLRAGELWAPTISQRQPYDAWAMKGEGIEEIARQRAKEILANHRIEQLPGELSAEFDRIIRTAQAVLIK